MRLKNKLLVGVSSLSLLPLAAMSCSNERSAEENEAIMNAAASIVQIAVYNKDSQDQKERVKYNIDDVYSTYVQKVEDIEFYNFDKRRYSVVEASFTNFSGKTVVRFKLKDIKTGTLSDEQVYTISGFKLNPEYTTQLTANQTQNVELFKSEMRAFADTNIASAKKVFEDLRGSLNSNYTEEQFNKDLKTFEDYLNFLQSRFQFEDYSTDFEVNSYGDFLDHKVDEFEKQYPEFRNAYHRLLTLKAEDFLKSPEKNGLNDKTFDDYVQAFKDRYAEDQTNPYWSRNPELREKYQPQIEAILDELKSLTTKPATDEEEAKLQDILGQFDDLDLPLKDKVKYVVLKLLNPTDGGNKVLSDLEAEFDKLKEADKQVALTDEQAANVPVYQKWIKKAQVDMTLISSNPNAANNNERYTDHTANPISMEEARKAEKDFWNNQKDALQLPENNWYTEEQFDKDVETVDDFYKFLQEQNVTDKDEPATEHWDFKVENLYDYKKYNVDIFAEKYPQYIEAITRLNSLLVNKWVKADTDKYDNEKVKTRAKAVLDRYKELVSKAELRSDIVGEKVRATFGGFGVENYAQKIWENKEELAKYSSLNEEDKKIISWTNELEQLGLVKPGSSEILRQTIEVLNGDSSDAEIKAKQDKIIVDNFIDSTKTEYALIFLLENDTTQLEKTLDKLNALYAEVDAAELTNDQKEAAKEMQKWIRISRKSLPTDKYTEDGTVVNYEEVITKYWEDELNFWKGMDLTKDPIYANNLTSDSTDNIKKSELFNSDLEYYEKFMKFLQTYSETTAPADSQNDIKSFIDKALSGNYDPSDLTTQKPYYEGQIDLFKLRYPEFRMAYGRLKGLAAYNWISKDNNSELISKESLDKLYEENKELAKKLFFVDMTNISSTQSDSKPTIDPAKTNYEANFDIIKTLFQQYNDLLSENSDQETQKRKDAFLYTKNFIFGNDDSNLRDRYFGYFLLQGIEKGLKALEKTYDQTPVDEQEESQIKQLQDYLKNFDSSKVDSNIEFIKNKVTTLLDRNEGEKSKYSMSQFLGDNADQTPGEYGGDLGTVQKFWKYLGTKGDIKTLEANTKRSADDENKTYSLKQYSDNNMGEFKAKEAEYRAAFERIFSYVVESFLETENVDPLYASGTAAIKDKIEEYIQMYQDDKINNQEDLKLEQFAKEIEELDGIANKLGVIKESDADLSNWRKKLFISLPDNSVPTDDFIRVEELSRFILELRSFEAHLAMYKGDKLTEEHKADVTAKAKELVDNNYLVENLDQLKAKLLEVNSEFIHDAHDADDAKKVKAHDYPLNAEDDKDNLTHDIELIINFHEQANKLNDLLQKTLTKNSERIYKKAIEQYLNAYNMAKLQYELALERIYNNKLDLYKLKAYQLNELEKFNTFDHDYSGNTDTTRIAYSTSRSTQKSLLVLFGLDAQNNDVDTTEEQKVAKAKEVLKDKAKEGDTAGAKLENVTEAINSELRLFIKNVNKASEVISDSSEQPSDSPSTNN